ncbi:hypothetical protein AKJ09_00246 [Labilithrix luteola]|uniref:Uncharacterized protein n=1 Tax=Labilithrix luteola TaxID=1391654 RepID=A0A0K1PJ86_9BACT|nr:hypothetical protein [Labilithrix luteola]AKU93582.1 hypothetical protein AKJ09_00246 [Labilithrix luteola]
MVEVLANGMIAWRVGADGKIVAEVEDKDGKPISKDAQGTVTWKTDSGEPASAKLAYDDGTKALVATGPAPKADITELKYEITGKSGPLTGVLQVPVGGTSALVSNAKASTDAGSDAPGPNGGIVQVVGNDRIEIVADDESDEVRVYVLDAQGKVTPAGSRKITLGVDADSPEVIVLVPSSDGQYLTGKWKAKTDPSRITVVVHQGSETRVALVGWKPGTKLVVLGGPRWKVKKHGLGWGHGGKPVELRGKDGAVITPNGVVLKVNIGDKHDDDDGDDDQGHGKRKGKGKGHGRDHK